MNIDGNQNRMPLIDYALSSGDEDNDQDEANVPRQRRRSEHVANMAQAPPHQAPPNQASPNQAPTNQAPPIQAPPNQAPNANQEDEEVDTFENGYRRYVCAVGSKPLQHSIAHLDTAVCELIGTYIIQCVCVCVWVCLVHTFRFSCNTM